LLDGRRSPIRPGTYTQDAEAP